MTVYRDLLFIVKVLTPLVIAVIMPFLSYKKNLFAKIGVIVAIANALLCSIGLLIYIYTYGTFSYYFGGWMAPWGIEFRVTFLSIFISLIILSMSLFVVVFSLQDILKEVELKKVPRYYSLFLLLVFSLVGISLTNDIFNLFVFVEISTLSACALISIVNRRQNIEASLKYLIMSSLGSGCILFAIALIYMVTGHLNMSQIGAELLTAWELYPKNVLAAASFLVVGFSVKSAVFPVHVWLPDAYTHAPSSSSAILSGIVTKTYAIALIKILFTVFGIDVLDNIAVSNIFLTLATLSIIFGSVFAIAQADIKRMLAYSSVAQIGYVYMGINLASHAGLSGGLLHVLNHSIMKVGLFLTVGLIIHKTGKRRIKDFKGLAADMPIQMTCFAIFALSMIGIPPLSGFFSKWYLALGAIEADKVFYVVVILISSLLNAVYYLPIIISSFFHDRDESLVQIIREKTPKSMFAPVLILAFSSVFFGLFYTLPLDVIQRAVINLIG